MSEDGLLDGEVTSGDDPVWDPLEKVVGDRAIEFMWMFQVVLEDGTEVHAYKHIITRRYLHLSLDGRAYCFRADRCRYQRIAVYELAVLVFDDCDAATGQLTRPDDELL